MKYIGWLGAICFALCALPQAIETVNQGHADGITWGLLSLWLTGEILTLIYVVPKRDFPLIFNYLGNIILLTIIIYYKIGG